MEVIRVLSHVEGAYTFEQGEKIRQLIEPELESGRIATVSFAGLIATSSSFVNGAFVKLLEKYSYPLIRSRLRVIDSNAQINDLIRNRMEAAHRFKDLHTV